MKNIFKVSIMLLAVSSLLFLVQSCSSKKVLASQNEVVDLSGNWSLSTLNNKDASSLFKGTIPSLIIDQSKKSISGNGGCNTFSGNYTYEEGRFNAPTVASTLMMCLEENAEDQLLSIFNTESIVKMTGDKLTFYKKGYKVAEFVRAVNTVLLSGEWTLDLLNNKEATTLFKNSDVPTINFATADKHISGFAGCNNYNAPFTLDGYVLSVGTILSTRMACMGIQQYENEFIQALSDISTLSLENNVLLLKKEGKEVLRFKKSNE